MTRRFSRAALALLALVLLAAAPAGASDQAWLLGRWTLMRDPDNVATQWLEFAPDGRVALAQRNGPRLTGRYHASEGEIQIDYKVGSQSVITTLVPSTDKQELYARSAVTGRNAVYEKRR